MVSFTETFINSLLMLIYTAKQVIGYACIQHPMIGGRHHIDISSSPAFSHPVLLIKIAVFKSKDGISRLLPADFQLFFPQERRHSNGCDDHDDAHSFYEPEGRTKEEV